MARAKHSFWLCPILSSCLVMNKICLNQTWQCHETRFSCDECIMIKTSSFSKLARILQSNWPQNQCPLVSWHDIPTCKVWCWLIETQVIIKKLMFDLKLLVLASWQRFYSPIDPKINPYMCLDMTYPPAKFDVDWSKETQVIVKKN